MAKEFIVAAWAEDFAGLFAFGTLKEARAFASGWGEGAGNYGAGKTVTYVLPNDQSDLAENPDDHADVEEAMRRRAKP